MTDNTLFFNGIDGSSGDYLLEGLTPKQIAAAARGLPIEPAHKQDIQIRKHLDEASGAHYGLKEGLDPKDLSQAGWGVIFPQNLSPAEHDGLVDALRPLLEHRQSQAAAARETYYKDCTGENGYRSGESKQDFLKRFGRSAGPADPEKLPYYLLIVGSPEVIPYSFQYQLDVQYAVGRIHFDLLEDYYRYARSVVEAETRLFSRPKQAAFFGTANPGDRATGLSSSQLIGPLAEHVSGDQPDWKVRTTLGEQATKAALGSMLGGLDTPSLLFTASHGMGFHIEDPRQLHHQGALLCQDWPGPKAHKGPIPEDFYFAADDLGADADLLGLLAFFFACYGAGTPKLDNFYRADFGDRKPIAPQAFLAQLPRRMLSHPKGGALAVIGHVERAWGYSFYWDGVGRDLETFQSMLKRLMEGHPVGSAMEYFNQLYAERATDLTTELDETTPEIEDPVKIAGLWTSNNDSRNYAILGDPAVRLAAPEGKTASTKKARTAISELVSAPFTPAVPLASAASPTPLTGTPLPPLPVPPDESSEAASLEAEAVAEPKSLFRPQATGAESFGLFGDAGSSIQSFLNKIGQVLSDAIEDATSLEVRTYSAESIDQVTGYKNGAFTGGQPRLRAFTHMSLDGDAVVCVPEDSGEIDEVIWKIHTDMVQQAQASRADLLKAAVTALSGFIK
jgi:hypothetical protein